MSCPVLQDWSWEGALPSWLPGPARLMYAAARVHRAPALVARLSRWDDLIGPGDMPSHPEASGWTRTDALEVFAGWLSVELIACTIPESDR